MARPTANPQLVVWQNVAFCPAGMLGSERPQVVRFRFRSTSPDDIEILEAWPAGIIMANLAAFAADHRLSMIRNRGKGYADFNAVTQWIDLTLARALDIPYGGSLRADMGALANRVKWLQETPGRLSKTVPRGRVEEQEYRFNLTLCVMNEIRKAGRWTTPDMWENGVGALLRSELSAKDRPPNFFDEENIAKRIQRFRRNLRAGALAIMMQETLVEVMRNGLVLAICKERDRQIVDAVGLVDQIKAALAKVENEPSNDVRRGDLEQIRAMVMALANNLVSTLRISADDRIAVVTANAKLQTRMH